MLRLKASKRSREVVLYLPDREGWLSKSLRQAFIIALCLHGVGYLFFHIHYVAPPDDLIIAPIAVNIEVKPSSQTTAITLPQVGQYGLLEAMPWQRPPALSLLIEERTHHLDMGPGMFLPLLPASSASFMTFHDPYGQKIHQLTPLPTFGLTYQPVEVHLHGDLSGVKVRLPCDPFLSRRLQQKKPLHIETVRYHVQIDPLTGKVFYAQQLSIDKNTALHSFGRHLLEHFQVLEAGRKEVITGDVEIILRYETTLDKGINTARDLLHLPPKMP